ncbi:unnamed protein product [Owenia fusiformis]|uniref:Uncharacterized protein n=1 Tax=Owenia fusiformis TaxID=6347 RepID=A0A8J1UXP8_OWEFU|nr:unnamed protein product [Owenia fusiformis]
MMHDPNQQHGYAGQQTPSTPNQPPPPGAYQPPPPAAYQPSSPANFQNVVYNNYNPGPQPVVVQPGPTQTTIIQQTQPRPSSYLGLAIFTCLCCNILFGIPAIVLSVQSSSSADNGDFDGARRTGKISLGISLSGIAIALIVIAIALGVYYTSDAYKLSTYYYYSDSYGR